jgi:hypothetical protein
MFMTPPVSAARTHEDSPPVLGFNAKAGRLFLLDRVQDAAGDWSSVKTDVTMQQPPFAVDFGRLEVGWIHFQHGRAPEFVLAPFGEMIPAQPTSPGVNDQGKPLRFKAGFRVPVISNAIGGVREMAGNSAAMIVGMNELHTAFEAAPEARAGKIPVVRMTDVVEVESGQSSNFQPVFTIIAWADRPPVLGPRTVPPPGAPVTRLTPRAEAAHAAPARRPVDDESWREEFNVPAGMNGRSTPTAWHDDAIGF